MNTNLALRQRRAADVWLMAHPERWSAHPFLPLTRRLPDSEELEFGVLYDARGASGLYGYSATVFRTNLVLLPATEREFLQLPRCVYDTWEEVVEAGWTVD
jgi:hypothetical protein